MPTTPRMRNVPVKPRLEYLLVALLGCVCLSGHDATTAKDAAAEPPQPKAVLYAPVEADLQAEYDRDQLNKKVQSWKQYWEWVQTFYKGNFLSEGWTRFCEVTLAVVKSEPERDKVLRRLNEVGKLISREWAKDGSVGRITIADLRRWNDKLALARRSDDGSGQRILANLELVREDLTKLKGQ
jgi:hypothetical protein